MASASCAAKPPFWERLQGDGKITRIMKDRVRHRLERDLKRVQYDIHLFTTTGDTSLNEDESLELSDLIAEEQEILGELDRLAGE